MTLERCTDLSPAEWIVGSDLRWDRLVTFGPAGFEAYARLRFLPDPRYPGQPESDVDVGDGPSEHEILSALLIRLASRTTTPADCYFCVWDGWGVFDPPGIGSCEMTIAGTHPDPNAVPAAMPTIQPEVGEGSKVTVPNRSYYLFHGSLIDLGDWGVGEQGFPEPAFIWPADHVWCVSLDVDPHWAGIGSDQATVDALVADSAIDVVPADPAEPQPFYR